MANEDKVTSGTSGSRLLNKSQSVHLKTLGGRQFWGDLKFFHGWRIQQNVLSKHCRLIDAQDYRRCSGTLKDCEAALGEVRPQLGPMKGHAVIFVHGIVRSSKSFSQLEKSLKNAGFLTVGFDYPSTREQITESTRYLESVVRSLEGVKEISFVVHSMGGLLVRSYLTRGRDPRIKRMVMLGVPNKGAKMADMLKNNLLFKGIFGPAGQQLISDSEGFARKLPTPDFEFGIIAGGRGTERGFNPLIPGDNDITVSVESTRLPGATDFLLVNAMHSFMMNNKQVISATERFLKEGRFRENAPAQPIPFPSQTVQQSQE